MQHATLVTLNMSRTFPLFLMIPLPSIKRHDCRGKGGHVATYTDPSTGHPLDYGVLAYLNVSIAKDFFAKFNVSIEKAHLPEISSLFVDFATGRRVPNFPTGDSSSGTTAALAKWAELTASYQDMISPSYYALPDPVPEDLAMPFGDFIAKYNLQPALQAMWLSVNALGDILSVPTLFVMQNFDCASLQAFKTSDFFVPASHNNSELYAAIQSRLSAQNLLLSSTIVKASRDPYGVKCYQTGL